MPNRNLVGDPPETAVGDIVFEFSSEIIWQHKNREQTINISERSVNICNQLHIPPLQRSISPPTYKWEMTDRLCIHHLHFILFYCLVIINHWLVTLVNQTQFAKEFLKIAVSNNIMFPTIRSMIETMKNLYLLSTWKRLTKYDCFKHKVSSKIPKSKIH